MLTRGVTLTIVTNPDDHTDWRPRNAPLGPAPAPAPAAPPYPPVYGEPPARRRRRPTGLLIAGGVVLAVGLAVGGVGLGLYLGKAPASPGPATVSLVGSLTLANEAGVQKLEDTHCTGMNGYDDIHQGTQITVTDESGSVLAVGQLGAGILIVKGPTQQCLFSFNIPDVPAGHRFYGVNISHRGTYQVQRSDLGSVDLSLGG